MCVDSMKKSPEWHELNPSKKISEYSYVYSLQLYVENIFSMIEKRGLRLEKIEV